MVRSHSENNVFTINPETNSCICSTVFTYKLTRSFLPARSSKRRCMSENSKLKEHESCSQSQTKISYVYPKTLRSIFSLPWMNRDSVHTFPRSKDQLLWYHSWIFLHLRLPKNRAINKRRTHFNPRHTNEEVLNPATTHSPER